MKKFATLLLPLLVRAATASTAVPTAEDDDMTVSCDGELDLESADPTPFSDAAPVHEALQERQEKAQQQFPPMNFRVFNHVIHANETVQGGYVAEDDLKQVVEMLSTDFGRFGVSFTYINTTYTLNETLTTVLDRNTPHYRELVSSRHLGQYADLNLIWMAFIKGAKAACTMPTPKYWNGEVGFDTAVRLDSCTLRAMTVKDVGGKVIAHEVGHWLGLFHPWDLGCADGDYVADTWPQRNGTNLIEDKDKRNDGKEVYQCGKWYPTNRHNFMDYYPNRTHFTDLQGERIRANGYLRHKYSAGRTVSTTENELWAGCKVDWKGPKSFPNGLACETMSKKTLSCTAKAATGGSEERFTIEAPCPLNWLGPAELDGAVNCEELNFNHFQCKPTPPSQTVPAKGDEDRWIWGIVEDTKPQKEGKKEDEDRWVWGIAEDLKTKPKQDEKQDEKQDKEKPWVWTAIKY